MPVCVCVLDAAMDVETLLRVARFDAMPHDEYLLIDAMSNSGLKRLRRSPAHYRAPITSPDQAASPEPTAAMFAGTLAHCALLEPDDFYKRYVIAPENACDKRTKAYREFAEAAAAEGRTVITQLQADVAWRQAVSIVRKPDVRRLFTHPGLNEVSVFWRDPLSGVLCKARPDRVCLTPVGPVLFDYKTTSDASVRTFARHGADLGYHRQAHFYSRGWEAATGEAALGVVFGVVEAEFPHESATYMWDDEALDHARLEVDQLLALAAQCAKDNAWPGYPEEMQLLSLPNYMLAAA